MFEERYYQTEAVQAPIEYYSSGGRGDTLIALPTGTGKAYVIAKSIKDFLHMWPRQRFIMLTDSSTLVKQNAETLENIWPFCPLGINSDELGRRDFEQQIIFGGIASMYRNPEIFGHRDILFIDECHMISPKDETMYRKFINGLRAINPRLIVIGYTATPFRMGQGLLTEGENRLFDEIIYDQTGVEPFNRMIREGYLAPLVPRPMDTQFDFSKVKKGSDGDYNQKQAEEAIDLETLPAIDEIIKWGNDRHCWLLFAGGIKNADKVARILTERGYPCAAIHSKNKGDFNTQAMKDFKSGKLRGLVNYGKLTKGFDWAPIDLLVVLRKTLSASLWVQILGRGTRPYDCYKVHQYRQGFNYIKYNCLVLDFARNTAELGPINDPKIPKEKGKKAGDTPIKICETEKLVSMTAQGCGAYNHTSARFCCGCGEEFRSQQIEHKEASTMALIAESVEIPLIETYEVTNIQYVKHANKGGGHSFKVLYQCGYMVFTEFVALENTRGKYVAEKWFGKRTAEPMPTTVDAALEMVAKLRIPRYIKVHINATPYPQINSVEF